MANFIGTSNGETINGTLDDDYIEGRGGNDTIFGDIGDANGDSYTGAVFVMGVDFMASSGNFHTFCFPPTLNFSGSTTDVTFNDDDGKLNGDDICNEYSDDVSQTVDLNGKTYDANVDYQLQYSDSSGNVYTFAVVDIDADYNGNHYNNVGENGKILIQIGGPEITDSTDLSLVPNSYQNVSSLDYSSFTEPQEIDPSVGGDDEISAGNGDDFVRGMGGNDFIEGDNGQDELYGDDGDDIIYGNTASPSGGESVIKAFVLNDSFTTPHGGEFHTFCFPPSLKFDGTSVELTFNDDDGYLNGDDYCNEYSDDATQTVTYNGQTYPVNVDYTLTYCDASGNYYKFAVIDVDMDGNGHHYYNLAENGQLLIQLEGPEVTANTQLSLVSNSYANLSKIDYDSLTTQSEDQVIYTNDEDYIDGGKGNDTIYGQWGDDVLIGGEGDDLIYGGQIVSQTIELDRASDGYWDISGSDEVTLDLSSITSSAYYNNSIGYYVLDDNGVVLKAVILADNAKLDSEAQAVISVDGAAKLGLFIIPDGDRLGFDEGDVTLSFDSGSPRFTQDGHIAGGYVSETGKNGDRQDHEINSGDMSSWEDLWCLGDGDFNDVQMKVKAISTATVSDKDTIHGNEGNDTIYGGDDDDHIYGDEGDDILYGQAGDDVIEGGDGNDILYGGSGQDILLGGAGNDELWGGPGSDVTIDGGEGVDMYRGQIGQDVFIFDQNDFVGLTDVDKKGVTINKNMYNADNGFDIMLVNGDAMADFTGVRYQADPNIEGNVIAGIEAVIGDEGNQDLYLNPNEILQQSDNLGGEGFGAVDAWPGFIAYLGEGQDSFNLEGEPWSYDAAGTPSAEISADMIALLGLNNAQVAELDSYVFVRDSGQVITIWTDAESVTFNGDDIF